MSSVTLRSSIAQACRRRPRRALGAGAALIVLVACIVTLAGRFGPGWRTFDLKAVGLSMDLPQTPEASRAPEANAASVYEVRTPHLAVLVAVFRPQFETPTDRPDVAVADPVAQAMAAAAKAAGLDELRYQVAAGTVPEQRSWRVSGTFRRAGVPSRVVGVLVPRGATVAEVLCFFSDTRGAKDADRILRSIRVLPAP